MPCDWTHYNFNTRCCFVFFDFCQIFNIGPYFHSGLWLTCTDAHRAGLFLLAQSIKFLLWVTGIFRLFKCLACYHKMSTFINLYFFTSPFWSPKSSVYQQKNTCACWRKTWDFFFFFFSANLRTHKPVCYCHQPSQL